MEPRSVVGVFTGHISMSADKLNEDAHFVENSSQLNFAKKVLLNKQVHGLVSDAIEMVKKLEPSSSVTFLLAKTYFIFIILGTILIVNENKIYPPTKPYLFHHVFCFCNYISALHTSASISASHVSMTLCCDGQWLIRNQTNLQVFPLTPSHL